MKHATRNAAGNRSTTRILREDHKTVKNLFRQIDAAEDENEKYRIFEEVASELKVHSKMEEEIFYPAVREYTEGSDLIAEAVEEHHAVDVLIEEIEKLGESDEDIFDAKVELLREDVERHIEEEEDRIFPAIENAALDHDEIARRMLERKHGLQKEYMHAG